MSSIDIDLVPALATRDVAPLPPHQVLDGAIEAIDPLIAVFKKLDTLTKTIGVTDESFVAQQEARDSVAALLLSLIHPILQSYGGTPPPLPACQKSHPLALDAPSNMQHDLSCAIPPLSDDIRHDLSLCLFNKPTIPASEMPLMLKGLRNRPRNICFRNSFLQVLVSCAPLSQYLVQVYAVLGKDAFTKDLAPLTLATGRLIQDYKRDDLPDMIMHDPDSASIGQRVYDPVVLQAVLCDHESEGLRDLFVCLASFPLQHRTHVCIGPLRRIAGTRGCVRVRTEIFGGSQRGILFSNPDSAAA